MRLISPVSHKPLACTSNMVGTHGEQNKWNKWKVNYKPYYANLSNTQKYEILSKYLSQRGSALK